MYALSAADAVSPALQRTRAFLFRPFRLGTYLKLCLVACITEGAGGNFSGSGGHAPHHRSTFFPPTTLSTGWIIALVAILVISIALGFVVYYLVTRLRFAYFHCLIHNTKAIRPGWRLYRTQAARFFWLNLVVGVCFLLVVILIALPFVAGFWKLFHNLPPGDHPGIGSLLSLVLPLIPVILLLAVAAIATDLILRDLMLPHFALENARAGDAWSAVWARIKAEKGSFFAYALLRIVLPIVAVLGLFMVLILPGILFFAVIAGTELGIHVVFSHASSAAAAIGVCLQILIGVAAFGIALLVGIGVGGPLSTAIRQYALLFYGSRYQPLAELLWPNVESGAPGLA